MAAQPPTALTRGQKTGWFFLGFVSWFIVHGLLGALAGWLISTGNSTAQTAATFLGGLLLLANVVALAVLVFFRRGRWVALGILGALAIILCIVLTLGVVAGAVCFRVSRQGSY